jgi:peptidoglycan/xylan/chitin deacetylase (PgdA/CDA1 family)
MRPVPVLLYHSVSSEAPAAVRRWAVSPARFADHMRWLADNGFSGLTVDQLLARRRDGTLPDRPVAVTFDDGFADFLDTALPVLERVGLPATLYVTTGLLTGSPLAHRRIPGRTLDAAGVREVAARGVQMGAHSHSHPQLDTLSLRRARTEIVRSRAVLEDTLGEPVTCFAYPYGYSSAAVRRAVEDAGYTSAVAVGNARTNGTDDVFALSRITVERGHDVDWLSEMLDAERAPVAPRRERLRTKAWRTYRYTRARLPAVRRAG